MRLIDADALRKQFDDIPPFVGLAGSLVHQYIDEAPTVDAVEVVRCNDFIYYHRKIGYGFGQCSKCRLMPYPEDFCSYGERKYGDGNG